MKKLISGEGIYLSIHDGTAYRPVACLTSNGLSKSQEMNESEPNKCDPETYYTYGKRNYEISAEGQFVDPTDPTASGIASYEWLSDFMDTKADAAEFINWRETTKAADGTTTYRYGVGAITSLELTAGTKEVATFSLTIQGIGKISKTDPKAGV